MIFVKDSLSDVNKTQVNESGSKEDLELSKFLNQFQDVFIDDIPRELPPKRGDDDHAIELIPGSSPHNKPPYRVSQAQQEEIMRQVNELVEKGTVRPSSSPFCSPVLLVHKKDGTYCMCVDYRALNKITIKNKLPVLRIEDLFDKLQGSTYFNRIDLKSGYHQIRIVNEDILKTAFRTTFGLYEYLVMPFGLTNALATFNRMMERIFRPHRNFTGVFFDDVIIYSKSMEEHKKHLQVCLPRDGLGSDMHVGIVTFHDEGYESNEEATSCSDGGETVDDELKSTESTSYLSSDGDDMEQEGEQGLVSYEECLQPVTKKSENASVEEDMGFCDGESVCEEVVQVASFFDDGIDDNVFFDSLMSETGDDAFFSSSLDTGMLENVTCECFDHLLDEEVPLAIITVAPKKNDACADAFNVFKGVACLLVGMYAFQCLLKAAFVAHDDVTEIDGQTEQVNQVIEDMLRAYCNQQPQKWIKFLHLVEFAYNYSHHRSLGMSPFKALYGQECLVPLRLADPTLHVPAAKSTLEMMDQQLLIIRDKLKRASDRQKSYTDLHRSARSFSKGEWVFLRV
ncbi:hypothetical protein L7F22_064763 [Adiantum nelumboides]|nr:hypothetical protein [Adiantum nelumboides]